MGGAHHDTLRRSSSRRPSVDPPRPAPISLSRRGCRVHTSAAVTSVLHLSLSIFHLRYLCNNYTSMHEGIDTQDKCFVPVPFFIRFLACSLTHATSP